MPELPEVETTRRGLAPALVGRTISRAETRVPMLRFPLPDRFTDRLTGRRVERISRRGKFLLFHLDSDEVFLAHLGMSGRFRVLSDPLSPVERHDHVLFWTDDGTVVRFNDPRRFGFMDLVPAASLEDHPQLRTLGPEPLDECFVGAVLGDRLRGRATSIKAALIDQRVVAGLGNIYACEALFWAGISPRRRAGSVPGRRADRLAKAIRKVLSDAIEAGGSSLRDFRHADGQLGYFQASFAVYDREGRACPACPSERGDDCSIRRIVQGGRSTFYCPRRQR